MPRSNRLVMGGLLQHHHHGYCKIRKRGCSSSASSTSSRLHNYRVKRTILLGGKARGGSRSVTPVPAWRTTPSSLMRSSASATAESPNSRPVSARKLAATLWEMNDMPSPGKSLEKKLLLQREKKLLHRGPVPPHLSAPSHSPASEITDRSGTGSRHRRTSSTSQKLRLIDHNVSAAETLSSASLMELETRSLRQTPRVPVVGDRNHLKDLRNALTTSKGLLKIINRIWSNADQPSSSMSLVSALNAELDRACLQVNKLIQEERSGQTEISYLVKCFAEEKAAWKHREQKAVEAAVESVAGELQVEKKLRRRFESLNKKLGRELGETKSLFGKALKELEAEKRAREVLEQVCNELAKDVGEERAEVEELKRESSKLNEEVEKEREMLKLADMLREERVQMKLLEAKHEFEDKNEALDKLRKQLDSALKSKGSKKKGCGSQILGSQGELAVYLNNTNFGEDDKEDDDDAGEVEDAVDGEDESAESDLHSIELKMDNNNKSYKWAYRDAATNNSKRVSADDENRGGNPTLPRRSSHLQRSISEGVEWGVRAESPRLVVNGMIRNGLDELEGLSHRKSNEEMQRYQLAKGLRDRISSNPRLSVGGLASPTRQCGQPWSSLDPGDPFHERPIMVHGGGLKSRLGDVTGEMSPARRSKRSVF